MSSDSETSKSLSVAGSLDESEDLDEDWRVIESEMWLYCKELLADIPHEEDSDDEEQRDLDGLTPAVLETRYEGTMLVDTWYVKLFELLLVCSLTWKVVHINSATVYFYLGVSVVTATLSH